MTAQPAASAEAMQYSPTSWTLEFQGHPLSPNDHVNRWERALETKTWKWKAGVEARIQGVPKLNRIRVSAVFMRRNLGVADEDNDRARLKPVLDGLVAAGVVKKDTREFVEWGSVIEERGPRGCRVIVEAIG